MAKLVSLEEISHPMRSALLSSLRVSDEATVLPQAQRSIESGGFKNVVMRIAGDEGDLNPDVFSGNWFSGVSMVRVPNEIAEPLLSDPAKRASTLKKLSKAIPSELCDSQVQVGPEIEGDDHDRDIKPWTAGFDSSSCCVGLYSAQQSRAPELGLTGMDRAHGAYYLICKAGGGVAAQTFHARLRSALRSGKSLDEALDSGTEPGPQALRRVSLAAQRNRQRILLLAAEALGFHSLDTIGDQASCSEDPHRGVITTVDVTYNSLRKVEGVSRSIWQYAAGCVDAGLSQGLITSSNVAEGFVAFTNSQDEFRLGLRNDAYNCLPFATLRLASNREIATKAAAEHKKELSRGKAHPDHDWIHQRFSWCSKDFGQQGKDIEPVAVWGSHDSENFLSCWARELGVASCKPIRLAPEMVAISALEQSKLRAALQHVKKG